MKRVTQTDLDYPGHDGLYYLDDEPFTGLLVGYDGARVRSETEFRDGVASGVVRVWHESGALASEKQSAGGVLHGLSMEWSEKGQLIQHETYELGVCLWRRVWDEQGQLIEEYQLTESDNDFKTLEMLRRHFLRSMAYSDSDNT
jgi:hypothetical protein